MSSRAGYDRKNNRKRSIETRIIDLYSEFYVNETFEKKEMQIFERPIGCSDENLKGTTAVLIVSLTCVTPFTFVQTYIIRILPIFTVFKD